MAGVVILNQASVTLYDSTGTEIAPGTEATLATRASEVTLATRATEATLEAARVLLVALEGKDFATQTTLATRASESTLAAADAKLATIDAVLDLIKDTEGIADLRKWLGSAAPTVGQKEMVASIPVTMSSDQPAIQVVTGAQAGTETVSDFLLDGASSNMVVNGSVTPVTFSFDSDPTNDIQLTSLRLVFSASSFLFTGASFGKGGGALANGVTVDIVANNGTFVEQLSILTVNEDFLRLLDFSISQAGSTDVLAASLPFGGNVILEAGTADNISVTINDNLTVGARGITYFTGTVYGVELT